MKPTAVALLFPTRAGARSSSPGGASTHSTIAVPRSSFASRCLALITIAGTLTWGCARGVESDEHGVRWSDATALSSSGGAAPVMALSPAGALTAAWVSAPDGGTDGRLYVRPDVGAAATAELRDSLGSLSIYGEVPPKIAYAPDGTLYAAYLVTKAIPGQKWPRNALRFAASASGGARWSPPVTATGGGALFGSFDDHALHIAPDGTIFLTWLAVANADTSHTYFARSTDRGATWTAPAAIDLGPSCPCCRTAMASDSSGALYVAWRKIFPGGIRDIAVARSTDRGATWGAPVRVHADGWKVDYCPDAGPSIKVGSDDAVHIAWWTGKEGAAGVKYAQSHDAGATWSAPVPLGVAAASRASHVQLAVGTGRDSGVVVAAWDDGTRQVPQIVVRISRDGGRTFSPTEALTTSNRAAGYPVIALHSDTLVVAWQERLLAAARRDSAARAAKDKNDASTYINAVGSMRVMTRRGTLQ